MTRVGDNLAVVACAEERTGIRMAIDNILIAREPGFSGGHWIGEPIRLDHAIRRDRPAPPAVTEFGAMYRDARSMRSLRGSSIGALEGR